MTDLWWQIGAAVGTIAAAIVAAWAKVRGNRSARPIPPRPVLSDGAPSIGRLHEKVDGLTYEFREMRDAIWRRVNAQGEDIAMLKERTKDI